MAKRIGMVMEDARESRGICELVEGYMQSEALKKGKWAKLCEEC